MRPFAVGAADMSDRQSIAEIGMPGPSAGFSFIWSQPKLLVQRQIVTIALEFCVNRSLAQRDTLGVPNLIEDINSFSRKWEEVVSRSYPRCFIALRRRLFAAADHSQRF